LRIHSLKIEGRTFLAPLAGITNFPFRRLVKKNGCGVVCSEMISAKGIFYNSKNTLKLLASDKQEHPLSVQIFGSEPESMAEAAGYIQDLNIAGIIDINFGCSVKKVVKQGSGVALMKEPELSRKILKAVRAAVDLPFTIKLRSGWDYSGKQAFKIAQIAQECGVNAIILHPRTAGQGFKGRADWTLIRKLKQQLSIPVIGNGDIKSVEDAATMLETTECDGVMAGRAVMTNPFLLSQIDDFLETGSYRKPGYHEIFRAMKSLSRMYVDYFKEEQACRMLRSRLAWFVKGMPGCSAFRKKLTSVHSELDLIEMIDEFEDTLA